MTASENREDLFIAEYLANNCNGTKAHEVVFGTSGGSARTGAWELLTNPDIKSKIDAEVARIVADKAALTIQVINEYKKIAFSNINEFVNPATGEVVCDENTDSSVLEGYKSKVVYEYEVKEGVSVKKAVIVPEYKMHPKMAALDSLAKYVIGFTEKKNITVTKLDELVEELRKR